MKSILNKILSFAIFAAVSVGCSQRDSDEPQLASDAVVVESASDAALTVDARYAKSGDGGVLLIDSQNAPDTYQPIINTKPLKPATNYTLRLSFKIIDPNPTEKFLHLLVRHGGSDNIMAENERGESGKLEKKVYRFRTPASDKAYTVQLHTRGKLKAEIAEFKLIEGFGESYYPARADAIRYTGDVGLIPTGADNFSVETPNPESDVVVDAADFGVGVGKPDFVKNMNAAIEHCRKIGASKLSIPFGKYMITDDGAVLFENLRDFEFDGNGSTLVYRKNWGENFVVRNCERVALRNFNMDWDWEKDPIASLVEVVDVKRDGDSYFDAKFLDYADFPNKNSRITILTGYDDESKNINAPGLFTRVMELSKGKGFVRKEWIAPNVLRVYYPKNALAPFKKGMKFIFSHYYYDMTAISMRSNQNLTIEDVNIFSCAGHAFAVSGTQKFWELKRVKIGIPEGSKSRYLSCAGDHFHVAYSRGWFKMEDCDFGGGNDDGLNAHDCSIFARKIDGANSVANGNASGKTLRTASARNVSEFYVGDEIELRNDDFSPTGFVAKIASITPSDASRKTYDISFDAEVPETSGEGFVLFNRRYDTRNIIIKNCVFRDIKARALLLIASDVTVENCTFTNLANMAIKIETGYTFNSWSEGYGAKNIIVRNSVFENLCGRVDEGGRRAREILISSYMRTDPSREKAAYPILGDIMFENNVFKNPKGVIAEIHSAANIIFRNNDIVATDSPIADSEARAFFVLSNSSDIKIINNNFKGAANMVNAGVYIEEKTVSNVVCAGNKLLDK